jgi:N-acetylmuramoyl-L-alanine amidase
VECGFITNAQDRIRLSNENVLKRLGENISNGIIYYLNENYKK